MSEELDKKNDQEPNLFQEILLTHMLSCVSLGRSEKLY